MAGSKSRADGPIEVPADFDSTDPAAWFARQGLWLRVLHQALRLPGRKVWGAWDPSTGGVTLFGCGASRPDRELVHTLGHEIWHVMRHLRGQYTVDEPAAEAFGAALVERLGPERVAACACALRDRIAS